MKAVKYILTFLFLSMITGMYGQAKWLNYTANDSDGEVVYHEDIVWIGGRGGLTKYDQSSGEVTYYNAASSDLPHNYITHIEVNQYGQVAFQTNSGYYGMLDDEEWFVFDVMPNGWVSTLNSSVRLKISKDSDGNFYFNLLSKMVQLSTDGELSNYSTGGEPVYEFAIDGLQNNWVERADEVVLINGQQETEFNASNAPFDPSNQLQFYLDDYSGEFYVLERSGFSPINYGLYKFDDGEWDEIDLASSGIDFGVGIMNLDFAPDGVMWMTVRPDILVSYDQGQWNSFDGNNIHSGYEILQSVDPQGYFWMYGYNTAKSRAEIYKYDGEEVLDVVDSNAPLYSNSRNEIRFDNNGLLWLVNGAREGDYLLNFDGENWSGIDHEIIKLHPREVIFNAQNEMWLTSTTEDLDVDVASLGFYNGDTVAWHLLPFVTPPNTHYDIYDIELDADGNVWLATIGLGLLRFDGEEWTIFDETNSILPRFIQELSIDNNGVIWIATPTEGFFKMDGQEIEQVPLNFTGPNVTFIFWSYVDHNDNVWVSYNNGFGMYDGTNYTDFNLSNSPLSPGSIFDMDQDSNNEYWFGTVQGLIHYDGVNWTVYDEGVSKGSIRGVEVDKSNNNKWLKTSTTGLAVFNENGIKDVISAGVKPFGLMEMHFDCNLTVYPNPLVDESIIRLPKNIKNGELNLINQLGENVLSKQVYGDEVTLAKGSLAPGVYFYYLSSDGFICGGKIIIQ